MKIAFRTDASTTIGTGHVMRCLNLAAALAETGAEVFFVCRELAGNFCDAIAARGFRVLRLPAPALAGDFPPEPDDCPRPAHAAWLETSWTRDAAESIAAIEAAATGVDWLVVDHYALPDRWHGALRRVARRVMVIDDLADRRHDCELLLNQNLIGGDAGLYDGLLDASCGRLFGPEYALLPAIYGELRERIPPRQGRVGRVLIYYGGVDENNLTGRSLAAVLAQPCPEITVDVVVPVLGPHRQAIEALAAGRPNVRLHRQLPSLAALLATADIAFGAAGSTSWERLCLGLPSLVVSLSDNQRMIARTLHDNALGRWLGHHDEVDDAGLAAAYRALAGDDLDPAWSRRCRDACDGGGARRVAALMRIDAATPLTARPAVVDDQPTLVAALPELALAQDAPDEAPAAALRRMLRDFTANRLYLVEAAAATGVAVARFTRRDGAWDFRHATLAAARGHELGAAVAAAAIAALRRDTAAMLELSPAAGGACRIAVCSDAASWLNDFIPALIAGWLAQGHKVAWTHDAGELPAGDFCFFLSYGRIVRPELLGRCRHNLVVHESDLPAGRGWSPMTWQVVEGASEYKVTLFEAAAAVDSGAIYLQSTVRLDGSELVDELRRRQAAATLELCRDFVDDYPRVLDGAREQAGTPSYYPRRTPADSRLDPARPLAEHFNLLRVCDNRRYPAWFEHAGSKYLLHIHKAGDRDNR